MSGDGGFWSEVFDFEAVWSFATIYYDDESALTEFENWKKVYETHQMK